MPEISPSSTENKPFNLKEFLRPNKDKEKIFVAILLICGIVFLFFVLKSEIRSLCPQKTEPLSGAFFAIVLAPVQISYLLSFLGSISVIFIFLGLILELPYLYVLACAISEYPGKSAVALFFIYFFAVFVFSVLPAPPCTPGSQDMNICKAQIASTSVCFTNQSEWNSEGCGTSGCLFADYGVNPNCAIALKGTTWILDEKHFACGLKPA